MELNKVIFRLKPVLSKSNIQVLTKSNIQVLTKSNKAKIPQLMINQPALIFDHNLNKVIDYDNMSNESVQSFEMVFGDIYKSNIRTKFHKFSLIDFKYSDTNKFIGSNQIDYIKYSDMDIKSDIKSDTKANTNANTEANTDSNTESKIRCYLLDSAFIKSSIVIDRNLNIYHQILNSNHTIESDNDTRSIFEPYLAI
jgi:hypothetical protein